MAEETTKLYISQVKLPDGKTYWVKDEDARKLIDALSNKTTYAISSDAATTPEGITWEKDGQIITGEAKASATSPIYLVPAKNKESKDIYDEYISVRVQQNPDVFAWEKLGDTEVNFDNLGAMAYANTASGKVSVAASATANTTVTPTVTPADYTPAGSITGGEFQGASMTSTGTYTPAGTVTINSITPAGTNSTSDVTIKPTTAKIHSMDSAGSVKKGTPTTVVKATNLVYNKQELQGGSYTAPSFTPSVANEVLDLNCFNAGSHEFQTITDGSVIDSSYTITNGSVTEVTLPTQGAEITTLTGITSATAAAQKFSGSAVTPTASFAGTTDMEISVTGTTEGSNNPISFTGTPAKIAPKVTASGSTNVTLNREDRTITVTPDAK